MAAPTYIQTFAVPWGSTSSPQTTASFSVNAGDQLAAICASSDSASAPISVAPTGGSLTWTQKQLDNSASSCAIGLWTATVDANKSMTVTFTCAGVGTKLFGGAVLTFRASDGIGASSLTRGSGAPSGNITTTQANSAIVAWNADWAAVAGARTWRTNAGAFVETSAYPGDGTQYGSYGGYHADAGSIGTYAVGVTAPVGQTYSIVALEVKGTAVAITSEQEGYRWRNDDGSETTATWKAAQDTTINLVAGGIARLRFVVNSTGDLPTEKFQLQYRKVGAAAWRNVDKNG